MHSDVIGTGVFLGGRYSEKEVISFGGISEDSQRGVRSSNRIRDQPNADATQMERAQQQASARDPSSFSGKKHLNKFTLASFSDDVVVRRAAALGVSLGRTNSQVLQSVQLLKETDIQRNLFILKRKDEKLDDIVDDHCSLLLENATKLSQDLLEEELLETETHKEITVPLKKPTRKYKKKVKEVITTCRRSTRLKNKG
jgi:hypothetical protein